MSQQKQFQIGLFGFGVVGAGIYQVLAQTPSLNAQIRKVCIKHEHKERSAPAALFTTRKEELLEDDTIDIIVELIDDAAAALDIILAAFRKGKSVISANKACIAPHLSFLKEEAQRCGVSFLYEAAVCGSIPIIRNLEEYYDNDLLQSLQGIVNGSTNFILTRIAKGKDYNEALREAQTLGFAESDPSLDVEGKDAANKLSILLFHAYGIEANPDRVLQTGINRLHTVDAAFAREKGLALKLVATAQKLSDGSIAALVLPQFLKSDHQLFRVENEYNGVMLESRLADRQFLYGKGAGRYPTASAVISDISALSYQYRYEYKKYSRAEKAILSSDYYLRLFISFNNWNELNKWDFESIETFHSTSTRQYLIGTIHYSKLLEAGWFADGQVSAVLMPDGVIERNSVVKQTVKKLSLQLAGVS